VPRKLISLSAAAASLAAVFAAAPAQALVVSSDATNGLQMREPDNVLNRVKVSLVNAGGGLKYRVDMPEFGGRGIGYGPGCANISSPGRSDTALCNRPVAKIGQVSLGPFRDTFQVDPSFPDPINVADGGIGGDSFRLGAGNDTARGGRDDSFFGGAGNDDLAASGGRAEGGDGDDTLHAFTGANNLVGGAGDDTLTADARAGVRMIGGLGTDRFDAGGANSVIDARDGVEEQVECGKPGRVTGRRRFTRRAVIDLADTPGDADLIKGGCLSVDRAPQSEKTAAQLVSTSLKLRRGRAGVKVKCATRARCRGRVSLTVRGRSRSARFSIRGRRSATIRLGARRGNATVKLRENGEAGARTTRAALKVKR